MVKGSTIASILPSGDGRCSPGSGDLPLADAIQRTAEQNIGNNGQSRHRNHQIQGVNPLMNDKLVDRVESHGGSTSGKCRLAIVELVGYLVGQDLFEPGKSRSSLGP